jgi:hypothetical protein
MPNEWALHHVPITHLTPQEEVMQNNLLRYRL